MEINLKNADKNNQKYLELLHPEVRVLFSKFIEECKKNKIPIWIYSGLRSLETQAILRRRYILGESEIKAAKAGYSYHNYGLAIDIYVYNDKLEKFNRNESFEIYSLLQPIANKYGLRWLGSISRTEMHHFDYNKFSTSDLLKANRDNKVDEAGYVLLREVLNEKSSNKKKKISDNWDNEIGNNYRKKEESEELEEEKEILRTQAKVEKKRAVGIWQIIKFTADQYSLSQNINDATIAHSQGSLMNYVKNVVQAPWLQFWGDTVGDQYYFFARKEPFDYNGWTNLVSLKTIYSEEVLSDDLGWYEGDVFSWFQIIPRGSFLGQQNLIFAYISAVFFEEYAEVWGSKPNIQVSNYVNFNKINGQSRMNRKAIEDLRYMVESNVYLPFTRNGTITIRGTTRLKRGYKIFYHPTGEEFYIESISTRYSSNDTGSDFVTILQVSRGMKIEYTKAPTKFNSKSYFNLIDFSENSTKTIEKEEEIKSKNFMPFYFDENKGYLINLEEKFDENSDTFKQNEQFPNLRDELHFRNKRSLDEAISLIINNPKAEKFICTGFTDSDTEVGTKSLSKNRGKTLKSKIIENYLQRYKNYTKEELERKIEIRTNSLNEENFDLNSQIGSSSPTLDSESPLGSTNLRSLKTKAYERMSTFEMLPYIKKETKEIEVEGINWKVKSEVFQFFINRKQFAN